MRAINFAAIEEGDRWTKTEISGATESDPELSLFVSWLRDGVVPVDGNVLA